MRKQARGNKIWFVLMVSLLCVVSAIRMVSKENKNEVRAEGLSTAPTFGLYEKIRLADKDFTVVNTDGNDLKLLMNTSIVENKTWNEANTAVSSYPTKENVGELGNGVLKDKITLATSTDLKTDDTNASLLHPNIPMITSDWWLKDSEDVDGFRRFVSASNSLNEPFSYMIQDISNTSACTSKSVEKLGWKPNGTFESTGHRVLSTANQIGVMNIPYKITTTGGVNSNSIYSFSFRFSGPTSIGIATMVGYADSATGTYTSNQFRLLESLSSIEYGSNNSILYYAFQKGLIQINKPYYKGDQINVTLPNGDTYTMTMDVSLKKNGSYTTAPSSANVTITSKPTFSCVSNCTATETECNPVRTNGGTASARPFVTLSNHDIAYANTNKRTYNPSPTFGDVPVSDTGDDKAYLTLIHPTIKASLDATKEGVSGNVYRVTKPGNGILTVPISLSDISEGTSYISAKSTIRSVEKYALLKETTGTSDSIQLTLSEFTDNINDLSSIDLILYLENSGDMDTAYISEGTPITIQFMEEQTIAFDASNPTTTAYGSNITVKAKLTSDLSKQSDEPIIFSILTPEGDTAKAEIVSTTTYNKQTGEIEAVIKPLSGKGSFVVAIDKAGNNTSPKAVQQKATISLSQKEIHVHPVKPAKIYAIGETMMTLESTSDGLVSGDTIPSSLKPVLVNLDNSSVPPDSNNMIAVSGKWKMVYESTVLDTLTSFTDKYDVTLIDYDDDTQYVFETGISGIPTGWILVTPDANRNGWNKGTVTIKPSDEAIAAGYTSIEVVNDAGVVLKQGTTIEYTTSIDSVTPKVRLKKGNTTSDVTTLREIKIDLTKPTGTITVENDVAWVKGTKRVTITPSDTYSGIDTITVKNENGKNYIPVLSGAAYTFDADENAIYTITLTDKAGNEKELTQTVEKIETKEITLTAVPEDLTLEEPTKDITVTRDAGDSGIKTFILYYKETAQDTYEKLEDLDQTNADFTYVAEMNGIFKFELVNNAGQSKVVEVTITNVNPPVPVTKITAVYDDDNSKTYTSGKWTNHDIQLSLTNVNTEITDTVSWMISENGTDWEELNSTTKTISTSDILNTTYHFKAYITKNGTKVEETNAKKMTIKIDKIKPAPPTIKDKDSYGSDKWFKEDVKVETSITPKLENADIKQDIYVCAGTESECKNAGAVWTKTTDGTKQVSGNGSYEYYFKTIDEAGNESDLSDPVLVNINDSVPVITIKLNTNPIKDFINALTFGIFFKDTVNIDFSADMNDSDIYYILDSSENPTTPADDDNRWVKGTSTSLAPDAKAMIYVKAVSKAGGIGRKDSQFNVYADNTPPVIELPAYAAVWSKEITMEASISDAMSGVKKDSITYSIDGGGDTSATLTNGKITISNLKDGSYNVSVKASDHSGNTATAQTTVKIDHTKPTMDTPIADTLDYAKEHMITFHTSDALSGLASGYPKVDGDRIRANADGSYSFKTDTNKTYQIDALDNAGNAHTINYVESKIDDTAPVITNKVIENETDFKTKKKVSFDTADTESGIDTLTVTYTKDGETHNVNVQVPTTGDTYSFTATENATYTITVTDKAGNTKTETIKVENIDPDGIKIKDISDTSSWVKDEMQISFEVQVGSSGIQSGYPTVTCPDQTNIAVTKTETTYSFTASENSDYTITARNEAADEAEEVLRIRRIDKEAPVIHDISSNVTSTTWRGPQDITFHVDDDNDSAKTTKGSGMKSGYPKVSYMENGTQNYISVTQDTTDSTLYTFKAEKNTAYSVEAMDQVEHPVVTETIMVDHILDESMLRDISVEAKNNDKNITSGTWVKGDILFTISGGLDDTMRTKYQVAISDGTEPTEDDWQDLNMAATNQHKVTGNEKNKHYYFRVLPDLEGTKVTSPFIVNLDNTAPANVEIIITKKNNNPIARIINALTFGGWMKEAQSVSFKGTDNFTSEDDLRFEYREEKNGVKGSWNSDTGSLSYEDSDIVIYAKAIDQAGNESTEDVHESLRIDTLPPVIEGAKDQKEYKQYYLPRSIRVSDPAGGSGLKSATYTKDNGSAVVINGTVKLKNVSKQPELYTINAEDNAGNTSKLTFKIVPLPSIDDITGSDEDKGIIDQIQEELDEQKDDLTTEETKEYEEWIKDATDKWKIGRKDKLEDTDTGTIIKGEGDTTFDPKTELIVDEIKESDIPKLPRKAIKVYDVYMRKGNTVIQPDGSVKVYLPYNEKEAPIVYEIDDGMVREIQVTFENGYVSFVTDKLKKYAISNAAQEENTRCPNDGKDINIDTNNDGLPDVNVDIDGDCKADINIDVDGDKIPELNIDTNLDGKPDYNVDMNHDGKADMNIGPKPAPWIPEHCNKIYCTDKSLIPEINIDTDGDGKPDINIDSNNDGLPDINIDLDKDGVPDVNIDSDGDGKADTNMDADGDGNIDTPSNQDEGNQTTDPNKDTITTSVQGTYQHGAIGGAYTGDTTAIGVYGGLLLFSMLVLYSMKHHNKKS